MEEGGDPGEKHAFFRSRVRRVVLSPWFKVVMSVLVMMYLATAVLEVLAGTR